MSEQYDSLNEKTKLIDISMKYTNGDMTKAKEMASGQYLDNIVVKGKFVIKEQNISGIFLAFFNYIDEYIANVSSIITSSSELYDKVRVFDDWKTLLKDLQEYQKGDNLIDSQEFNYFLMDSFIGYDVFPDVHEHNLDDLTKTINEIISKSFNIKNIQCQIEMEPTSSLEIELKGITIEVPGAEDSRDGSGDPGSAEDDSIRKIENEAKYIVDGKAVLAPVSGKNISDLTPGEKIKVYLPGKDVISEKILQVLNAYDDDGNKLPVKGRLKAKVPIDKGGFIIYTFVAKGVLAKIIEEENVKIQMDQPAVNEKIENAKIDTKLIYLMGIIVGLIILSGIILLQLL